MKGFSFIYFLLSLNGFCMNGEAASIQYTIGDSVSPDFYLNSIVEYVLVKDKILHSGEFYN